MNLLLLPFAWVYGLVIRVRNLLFDLGIFKSKEFDVPVITVGNLRVGGTGKTPTVIALLELLSGKSNPAVLSRGYGRSSEGWREVNLDDDASLTGDEPLLIKQRNPEVRVAVMEQRSKGINMLLESESRPNVILLDDAMQHRWVRPGLLILLTAYHDRYTQDWLLPAGRLREHRSSAARADLIVVTKCPEKLAFDERKRIIQEVNPRPHQQVCFAFESYPGLSDLRDSSVHDWQKIKDQSVVLVTGLADPSTLLGFIEEKCAHQVVHLPFGDHHDFKEQDLDRILEAYSNFPPGNAVILTTEKDAQRFAHWMQNQKFAALPIYAIQHLLQWFESDREVIEKRLDEFIRSDQRNG